MDNYDVSKKFYEKYQKLNHKQCEKFSYTINVLLEENYLVYDNMKTEDYDFIVSNSDLIQLYFSLIS